VHYQSQENHVLLEPWQGVVTLTCTQIVVINAWFCVSNILEKNEKLQMEFLSHNVSFNVLVYIL